MRSCSTRYLPTSAAPPAHRQVALVDGGGEGALDERPDVRVDRVHLEHADLALDEHLVQNVRRRNRGHVAGAQHQRHLALPLLGLALVMDGGARVDVGRLGARLHPDFGGEAGELRLVERAGGKGVDHHSPVGPRVNVSRIDGRLAALNLLQRLGEEAQVANHHRRARQPLLRRERRLGIDALDLAAGPHALFGDGHIAVEELVQQRQPIGDGAARPLIGLVAQLA